MQVREFRRSDAEAVVGALAHLTKMGDSEITQNSATAGAVQADLDSETDGLDDVEPPGIEPGSR